MPRFALLGIHSKKLAGVIDANDPISACKKLEERAGLVGNGYEMLGGSWAGKIEAGMEGYDVHLASPDMEVKEEHREAVTVRIAEGLPRVAIVLVTSAKPAPAPDAPAAPAAPDAPAALFNAPAEPVKPDAPAPAAPEKKPDEAKPPAPDAKKVDDPKPVEVKKPDEPKPAEVKPAEAKPAEVKPAEAKKDTPAS